MRLELVKIAKHHPGRAPLYAGLNLTFEPGKFTTLVGPSGCGKSSLLRLIAGLDAPTNGSINKDSKSLGFVFQEPRLLAWRTVEENLSLPFELKRLQVSSAQIPKALEQVQLTSEVLRLYPHQLSGGMKMRVALARALMTQPDLLLMDEPLAALDESTRQVLQEEISRLHDKNRITTVFVTHSLTEALFLSDRIVMMGRNGELLQDERVYFNRPRDASLRTQPLFLERQAQFAIEFRRLLAQDLGSA